MVKEGSTLDQGPAAGADLSISSMSASSTGTGLMDLSVLDKDLSSLKVGNGEKNVQRPTGAPHKMHKKVPRSKNRSWRVNKEGEGPYKI